MRAKKTFIFIAILLMAHVTYPEEIWNVIPDGQDGVLKKFLNLTLQTNFIYEKNAAQNNGKDAVLVLINDTQPNHWFLKSLTGKFNPLISVMEYRTSSKSSEKLYFQKKRLRQYLKTGNISTAWPEIYPEVVEIEKELKAQDYKKKFLLLTGNQSGWIRYSRILESFDGVLLVSPDENLEKTDTSLWANKKILWLGANYEKEKLTGLQKKFGGSIIFYERHSTGRYLLLSSLKILDDIYVWLKGQIA